MARPWLPPLLLAAYAFAFAWRALGGGLLIVDDHPGQLYRLARVVSHVMTGGRALIEADVPRRLRERVLAPAVRSAR